MNYQVLVLYNFHMSPEVSELSQLKSKTKINLNVYLQIHLSLENQQAPKMGMSADYSVLSQ